MHRRWGDDWFMGARGRGGWGRHGDPWPEAWNEWMRGPAPRAERGTVRWLVLDAIADRARHGYEVIQVIAERSGGAYKPSPGVVYPTLQMLEEMGHVRSTTRDERKVYEITADGKRELAEHADDVREFYRGDDDPADWRRNAGDVSRLMSRVARLMAMFKFALRRGTLRPSTMRKIRTILDDALSKIEDLLGDEEP
jgi:DNA-binding PadR family transcriptional regulator